MNLYEIIILVKQEEAKTGMQTYANKIIQIASEENPDACKKQEYWGLRKLAYQIDGLNYAYYSFILVSCGLEELKSIKKYIKSTPKIIRHSIFKVSKVSEETSPVMLSSAPSKAEIVT